MIRLQLFTILFILIFTLLIAECFAQTTLYTYDDLNQLTKAEFPDGTVVEYTYDEVGNRLTKTVTKLSDTDSDGLSNDLEITMGTDPFDADTDDDGLLDGEEDANHNGVVDFDETDPHKIDTDGDRIQDGTELGYTLNDISSGTNTNVFQPDLDPSTTTDPLNSDTDGDSLTDGKEDINYDGKLDSDETNPLVINPVIISIQTSFGKIGAQIEITGTNFGDASQLIKEVIFYNELPASISSWSDTQIICNVPNGAQSGNIRVETDIGTSNRTFFSFAIYVPDDYSTIQSAIDAASTKDTIVVRNGTYTGIGNKNLDFNGKAITLTSENGPANCIINCENDGRAFYFHTGEGKDSVLSGFTITNGSKTDSSGGAIVCYQSSPTIVSCIITNNTAKWGGAILCDTSESAITNCTISNNTATSITSGYGGGIYCYREPAPTFTDCTISNNTATYGGGMNDYQSSSTFINCSFSNNFNSKYGGAIYTRLSTTTITNCTITGNTTTNNAGGIYCYEASPSITNCLITKNTTTWGGGLYLYKSSPSITNCTISNNTASSAGGGIRCYETSSPTITNSIFWNDSPEEILVDTTSTPAVTYSDFQGGYTGICNINSDPLFVNSDTEDYHLKSGSPCIDKATNVGAPTKDKDGISRPQDGDSNGTATCDIGVYEYDVNDPPSAVNDSYSVDEGSTINQAAPGVLVNDTDPENDSLTAALFTNISHGNLTLNTNGSFTYTHDGSETTGDSFTYKANDSTQDGNIALVTISINPVNDVPQASNDSYNVDEGSTINKSAPGVLINDTDIENDPLTAILVAGVTHGSLTLNTDGGFMYIHDGSETTSDSFSYKTNDGTDESNIAAASITINAVNDAPAGVNNRYSVNEGGTINEIVPGVLGNDTDAENSDLTAILMTDVSHGSLILNVDGSFIYIHDGSETTSDSFTYKANDGIKDGNIATVSISITAVNDAPKVESIPDIEFPEDGSDDSIDLDDYVLDLDHPNSQLNWTHKGNTNIRVNIDSSTHIVTFTAEDDWNGGPEHITFTVEDPDGASDSDTINVTVAPVNDPPIAYGRPDVTIDEDTQVDIILTGEDIDGDDLTYNIVSRPSYGSLNGVPPNIIYEPEVDYNGFDSFNFTVNDGTVDSKSATVKITINPINDPPVAKDDSYNVYKGGKINELAPGLLTNDTDVENDPLTANLVTNTIHGSIALNSDGSFTYTHGATETTTDSFRYKANDGEFDSDIATVSIAIIPVKYELNLSRGWNFISIPFIPDDETISAIFSHLSFGFDYDQVSRYNPDKGDFDNYNNSLYNQFGTMEYSRGYLVYVNNLNGVNVALTGKMFSSKRDVLLKVGWNLIGAPYIKEISVSEGLNNLQEGTDYDRIVRYNTSTQIFEHLGKDDLLKPGESYYLHCLKDTVWEIEPLK